VLREVVVDRLEIIFWSESPGDTDRLRTKGRENPKGYEMRRGSKGAGRDIKFEIHPITETGVICCLGWGRGYKGSKSGGSSKRRDDLSFGELKGSATAGDWDHSDEDLRHLTGADLSKRAGINYWHATLKGRTVDVELHGRGEEGD